MSEVLIKLKKTDIVEWPRLIQSKGKVSFISYDAFTLVDSGELF